jgi:hypothetical protein
VRELTIGVYLALVGAAGALLLLPRTHPAQFEPVTSVLDDVVASGPARIAIVTFWWWLGWHFLV